MSHDNEPLDTQERRHVHPEIRKAKQEDAEAITALIRKSYTQAAEKEQGFRFDAADQTVEKTRAALANQNNHTFVAVSQGGKIVGTITLLPQDAHPEDPEELKGDDIVEFGWFARDESFKGSGLGGQLLARVEQEARNRGKSRLLAVTAKDTQDRPSSLHRYYNKLGFAQEVDVPSSHEYEMVALIKKL